MVKPVRLKKAAVEKESYLVWNAYIDLLSTSDYQELSEIQRPAHWVFWYESEVQNGGHLQYFENQGTEHLQDTIGALKALNAAEQAQILAAAASQYLATHKDQEDDGDIADFVSEALKGGLSDFDKRFQDCPTPLQKHLADYLEAHKAEFVEIV
jgi:hypothetical protein